MLEQIHFGALDVADKRIIGYIAKAWRSDPIRYRLEFLCSQRFHHLRVGLHVYCRLRETRHGLRCRRERQILLRTGASALAFDICFADLNQIGIRLQSNQRNGWLEQRPHIRADDAKAST